MSARNTTKFKLDPKQPVKLTAVQRKRLKSLASMPDAKINYSDIPRQRGKVHWTRPETLVPSENKKQVTLRIDADVLKYFKNTGRYYQRRINAVLRKYMDSQKKTG